MGAPLSSTVSRRPFKRCPICQFAWDSPTDFLRDTDLRFIGLQGDAKPENPGLMMFNHSCGTTLAIRAEASKGY